MNWVIFLKEAYEENWVLINKDPQVVFNEKKFYRFAGMREMMLGFVIHETILVHSEVLAFSSGVAHQRKSRQFSIVDM